ncbi:MAG: glutamate--tRNA ligase [Patescibacteria group bacterium]
MTIRTRIAPSPTGEFHIGSMRTLMYNWALARKLGGQFILRIEDTDKERYVEGAVERMLLVIKKYGFDWDEGPQVGGKYGPYVQSERLDIYKKYALELVEKGKAYYCFCTEERLEKLREEQRKEKKPVTKYDRHCLNLSKEEIEGNLKGEKLYVIRMKIPDDEIIEVGDLILGKMAFPSNDLDDQILLKSDGFPTYHLGVVVDDHLMEITHILRGREWLASTPKHVLLYRAFGWKEPIFAHLPVLREVDSTKKMSKRLGDVAAIDFLKAGYLPEALDNFLMFLGWNPGTEKEVYTVDEFVKDFSIEKIQKSEMSAFDRQKLLWFNGLYIRNTPLEKLFEKIKDWHKEFGVKMECGKFGKNFDLKVLSLVQERMKTLVEFNDISSYFYTKPNVDSKKLAVFSENLEKYKDIIKNYLGIYEHISEDAWKKNDLDKISHEKLLEWDYKPKEAFMTLRYAVCGTEFTPPLFDVFNLIGKKETVERLKSVL